MASKLQERIHALLLGDMAEDRRRAAPVLAFAVVLLGEWKHGLAVADNVRGTGNGLVVELD